MLAYSSNLRDNRYGGLKWGCLGAFLGHIPVIPKTDYSKYCIYSSRKIWKEVATLTMCP